MFKYYEKNEKGRDYVVGDIHGCYNLLLAHLKNINFNVENDRLFSVGDLVDRGPQNEYVETILDEPWFHAVRGNHDQMAIDYAKGRCNVNLYKSNGGGWFIRSDKNTRERIAKKLEQLPVAMQIQTDKGMIGIVHADCPYNDWDAFATELQSGVCTKDNAEFCMWDRARIQYKDDTPVAGLYKMIVGHTPVTDVLALGNMLYIDTGAVYGRKMTILELSTL
jgi:serine/threonine protein phosphatase 1